MSQTPACEWSRHGTRLVLGDMLAAEKRSTDTLTNSRERRIKRAMRDGGVDDDAG
jgi:hypothetical protein